MLTQEELQRIEAEERKRHAEEQYRNEVRARLQQENVTESVPTAPPKPPNALRWFLFAVAGLIVFTIVVSNLLVSRSPAKDRGDAPAASALSTPLPVLKTRLVPVSHKVATGQIIVRAQGYVQYRITVSPEMREPTLTGNFTASGGFGNDITAVLADETNFVNWINGHQAQVFWGTPGRQKTGHFEVRLRPGQYYLVFSNKFSLLTDKQVFLEVDLNSKRIETYTE